MDNAQRYECWPENPGKGVDGKMFPDRCGKWVRFADYERVSQALADAEAQLKVIYDPALYGVNRSGVRQTIREQAAATS